jgi:hypothetical protein
VSKIFAIVEFSFYALSAAAQDCSIGWKDYLGGPAGAHYSPLKQINTSNVNKIQVAWTCPASDGRGSFGPLAVDKIAYISAKGGALVALDATTGKELWVHSFGTGGGIGRGPHTPRNMKITGITWPRGEGGPADQAIKDIGSFGYSGFETLGDTLDACETQGRFGRALEPAKRQDGIARLVGWGKLIRKYGGKIAVLRLLRGDALLGVLDLDSPLPGRVDDHDRAGCKQLAAVDLAASKEG